MLLLVGGVGLTLATRAKLDATLLSLLLHAQATSADLAVVPAFVHLDLTNGKKSKVKVKHHSTSGTV